MKDLKRYEEAEAAYRKAIELNPSDATAYYNLGDSVENLKRYEEAEAPIAKPSNSIRRTPKPTTTWVYSLDENLKRYEEAEAAYRKAIELNPSYAKAYNNLGLLLHENLKRYEEAEAGLSQSHRTQSVGQPSLLQPG